MKNTLLEVLSKDERVIVASSAEDNQFITWNRFNTFSCWDINEDGTFVEVDVKTYGGPKKMDYESARAFARTWMNQ